MPDWCDNKATFHHPDITMIQRLVEGYQGDGLMGTFFPRPAQSIKKSRTNKEIFDVISWSYDNWGTKWDICEKNNNRVAEISEDFKSVTLRFNSAWHPPFTFYENMIDLGFSVEAYYCRSNDEICGQFLNEREEEYYISDASSEEIPDIIPKAIDEALGITRRIAELEKIFEDLLEEEGEGDEEDEGEEAA